jgi:secreted PhoX family phosphatase
LKIHKSLIIILTTTVIFISCNDNSENLNIQNIQNIGDFTSVEPLGQSSNFTIPSTHIFQKIIEEGDALLQGGVLPGNNDFTGYVPIAGSSENGYLSINSELTSGGVSILDINYNVITKLWEVTNSKAIDFIGVAGTSRNCSGTVTPWNTIISCEEATSNSDANNDNRNDLGWCVELDPANKTVIDKRWALGNFKHENIVVHNNERTVYEGADSNPGYLYKFVADIDRDLSTGTLYVYNGSKSGSGKWIEISNTTPTDQNTTLMQSAAENATVFNGIEDVEIGPDGMVYFAVKGEGIVYRFQDSNPINGTTVIQMETFVGNTSYDIEHTNGTTSVSWGNGNDNLAFDGDGNLWVLQDGGNGYIWVVENGHTQSNPKVKIFGSTPTASEPTGITFSPDYRFLFMSIQHPSSSNSNTSQIDAAGDAINFDNDISIVIALNESLGI